MIRAAAPRLAQASPPARVLEDGCGLGLYIGALRADTPAVFGLEYDFERAREAGRRYPPLPDLFRECLPGR